MSPGSTSTVRVRYAETDQMGVAYHGGYFAWFEVGRSDLLRERGLSYRELEQRDLRLPVIEAQARFLKPAATTCSRSGPAGCRSPGRGSASVARSTATPPAGRWPRP